MGSPQPEVSEQIPNIAMNQDMEPTRQPAMESNHDLELNETSSLGDLLRRSRESMHWSIDEVAEKLYLEPRIIEALEMENEKVLPPAIFVQGYLRSYARLLNLPADKLVKHYKNNPSSSAPDLVPDNRYPAKNKKTSGGHGWFYKTMTLLIIVGTILLVVWRYVGENPFNHNFFKSQKSTETPVAVLPGMALPPITPPGQITPATDALESEAQSALADNTETTVFTPPSEASEPPVVEETETSNPVSAVAAGAVEDATTLETAETEAVEDAAEEAIAESEQATEAVETETPAAIDGHKMELSFTGDSWVSLVDSKGKKLIWTVLRAGDNKVISNGTPPLTLKVRHGKYAKLRWQNKDIDLTPHQGGDGRTKISLSLTQ
ncbi:RodZ domain-containing protein [Candidatus Venteria ishoeyi]|nr:RodZ domain-containing protein [Candidatus Venteria ishoeyi]MDM8544893.1 DUF4115 domain-containing protein [Candidatus Venteria ishoeyi]